MEKRARIYQRVSKLDDTKAGESLPSQFKAIINYAKIRGWQADKKIVYEDKGISAWKEKVKRPAFEQMLQDASNKQFDILIVYRLDRFSRRVIEIINVLEKLKGYGVEVVSVSENLDTTAPVGKATVTILAAMAQYQSDQLSAYMKHIFARLKSEGKNIGGASLIGFKYNSKLKKTEIDDNYKDVIPRIFGLFDEDNSYQKIAGILNAEGIKTPLGCDWYGRNIRRLLGRYEYIGKRKLEDGRIIDINYPKLVTEKLFHNVQTKLVTKKVSEYKKAKGLISGKKSPARCGICNYELGYHSGHSKKYGLAYYVCNKRLYMGINCDLRYVNAELVDLTIKNLMSGFFTRRDFLDEMKRAFLKEIKKESLGSPDLSKTIEKLNVQKDRLIRAVKEDILPPQEIKSEYQRIEAELISLKEKQQKSDIIIRERNNIINGLNKWIKLAKKGNIAETGKLWDNLDLDSKRMYISNLMESIKLYPKKMEISISGKIEGKPAFIEVEFPKTKDKHLKWVSQRKGNKIKVKLVKSDLEKSFTNRLSTPGAAVS